MPCSIGWKKCCYNKAAQPFGLDARLALMDAQILTFPRTWTSPEAYGLAGITYRQLDYWCRKGLIPNTTARGSGSRRVFSAADIMVAWALGQVARWFGSNGDMPQIVSAIVADDPTADAWNVGTLNEASPFTVQLHTDEALREFLFG